MQAANDIVLMLCSIHSFTFQVENTMVGPPTASSALTEAVTPCSKTDYICFSMYNQLHLTAVVLETKAEYHQNAITQLTGYYIRACANRWKPGICILLTTTIMQIILFPFTNEGNIPLVNAICLKAVNYKDNLEGHLNFLVAITCTDKMFTPQVILKGEYFTIEKDYCYEVESPD